MPKPPALSVETLRPGDSFEEWDRFVDVSPQGCIFCRSWWLDAVCGGEFEILALRRNGEIVAGIPLPISRRRTCVAVHMPKLTHTLGVLLAPAKSDKYESRLSSEIAVLRFLIDALPKVDDFDIIMHHTFTNWLPFYWRGYSQTTRYTYVIPNASDPDAIFRNMSPELRRHIRKARSSGLEVRESEDLDTFLALNRKTFARQGMPVPYPDHFVRRLDTACVAHNARKILLVTDKSDRPHTACYVVYDSKCLYNLMQGTDPEMRSSGAGPLAIWRSIQLSHEMGLHHDFEGSMMQNVERFFRSFGAIQKRHFHITKRTRYARAYFRFRHEVVRILRTLGLRS